VLLVPSLRWTEEAITDLVEIIDYIEQRNASAALNLLTVIMESAQGLPLMPYLLRPGRVAGTRECVVHPNYILVYQVGVDVIDVLRVLHAREQYP
jgi:addiction module RelE/StbE family toxin